ncbi:MAG TPA: helix-turn-helix domain-containing protein [Egibacteraceae bacterium]|nr:helix-turn-helix domain-containing protein [Egibacteraceae bacterium]
MTEENLPAALARLCTLDEPTRRAAYQAVRQQPPATRAQVAEQVGISVSLAAFHLDTLAEAGLLDTFYARLPGRGGPGAGRPAKWYRPSDVPLEVSVPPRRYELVGAILAEAIHAAAASGQADAAVRDAARQAGHRLAGQAPRRSDRRRAWRAFLKRFGYEPRQQQEATVFGNCPFAALARAYPNTICTANVALVDGLLQGVGVNDVAVEFQPGAGGCCVLLRST